MIQSSIYSLFTREELDAQLAAGMVKLTSHPTEPLQILNYTQMAQFSPDLWNHVTDYCRGLIVTPDGAIHARGFKKFWNLGDSRHPETLAENLPVEPPLLTRKMDGSLGIGYRCLDGSWAIATRGSFTSDQSRWATAWLSRCAWSSLDFGPGMTPLFEIIYPENQIVVNYRGQAGLTLLAVVNNATGEEMPFAEMTRQAYVQGITIVEQFDKPLAECIVEDLPNEEGYVAAWTQPGAPPLRVKIKYATYCRLHKLLTQTNAVTIWEMLRDGSDVAGLTADVPTEFQAWIASLDRRFRSEFKSIEDVALNAMLQYPGERNLADREAKKQFAEYALNPYRKSIASVLFAMAERKNYAPIIWKMIRPRGDESRFRVDADQ